MNRILCIVLLATAAGAARAEQFAPIKPSESVTYPLPPMPLPQVQGDGKWTETEDSPALRVSRAWVKLSQAAGVERSDATRKLYQSWKSEVNASGLHSRSSQASHARFLAAYKKDLEQARGIYEGVLRDVDSMDGDGAARDRGGDAAGRPGQSARAALAAGAARLRLAAGDEHLRPVPLTDRRVAPGCRLALRADDLAGGAAAARVAPRPRP